MADFIKNISNNLHYGSGYISSVSYFNPPAPMKTRYSGSNSTKLIYTSGASHLFNRFNLLNNTVNDICYDSEEDIVMAGGLFTGLRQESGLLNRARFVRLKSNGEEVENFNIGFGFPSPVRAIAIQDDKILVGGDFFTYNQNTAQRLARLDFNGNLDPAFPTSGMFTGGVILTIKVQQDGKILIGGTGTKLRRLNSNGTIDFNFENNVVNKIIGPASVVRSIEIDNNGKILVGGVFTNFGTTIVNNIVRLEDDGTLDTTFEMGSGFERFVFPNTISGNVNVIKIDSNNKILVGGLFDFYNGFECKNIIRLNENGSRDTSFGSSFTFFDGVVKTIEEQDNKILVGGTFDSKLIRLFQTGSVDNSFYLNVSNRNIQEINKIKVDNQKNIYVGASIIYVNNTTIPNSGIVKLLPNGSMSQTESVIGYNYCR